jgi:ABC-type nitrate/sulfonate/bicarbonate transport system substrate-binding protein
VTVGMALALMLAACGDGEDGAETASDAEPATEEDATNAAEETDEEDEGEDLGDPEAVRYINNVAQPLVGLAAEEHGYFEAAGVEVEFTEIETGTEAIAAMLGGSADFVTAADARLIQAAGQDLPVVAIGIHNTGFLGNLVVRADDDGTDEMEDLVGRRLGVQVGSGVHTAWLRYLDAAGLDESDFEVVNLAVADMPAALEGNSIDGGLMWQPHASRSVEEGLTRIAMTTFDIADPVGIIYPFYLLTSRDMVEERPEAVQRFVNAWVCTQEWIDDNPEEAADTLEPAFEGVDRSIVEAIFVEQRYADYQTIDDEVLEDTRGQAEKLVETGELPEVPDLDPFVDTSFVDNALSAGC